jgi:hypothetical protein
MTADFIPILCATCGERWKHPIDTITVVLLPGNTDEVWAVCPDCGPDRIRLDHASAALISYVFEPDVADWSDHTPNQIIILGRWLRISLQPAVLRQILNVELERIVGHCDEVVAS